MKVIYFYFIILYLLKSNYISISNACESNNLEPILERPLPHIFQDMGKQAYAPAEKKEYSKKIWFTIYLKNWSIITNLGSTSTEVATRGHHRHSSPFSYHYRHQNVDVGF